MTDPISDYLTRIRNAVGAKHTSVDIPISGVKKAITHILYEQGYIAGYSVIEHAVQGTLRLYLKYEQERPAITGLQRISRPGLRKYSNARELPRTLNGLGITIVSTPQGLMTDAQARSTNIGGEVLCRVW